MPFCETVEQLPTHRGVARVVEAVDPLLWVGLEVIELITPAAAAAPLLLLPRLRRAARRARFPNIELAHCACREAGRNRILANAWLLVARAAVVTLAALAVARPYVGEHPRTSGESAGRGIVVALDRSGAWTSMDAFEEARALGHNYVGTEHLLLVSSQSGYLFKAASSLSSFFFAMDSGRESGLS